MKQVNDKVLIGRVEQVLMPDLFDVPLHARIDTGAKNSAIWVSDAQVVEGKLNVIFLGDVAKEYNGETVQFSEYGKTVVASSNGHTESRYTVKLPLILHKRRIRATFTLADRSTQVYPILIGRNVLRGKFIVDVQTGKPIMSLEKQRTEELRKNINKEAL